MPSDPASVTVEVLYRSAELRSGVAQADTVTLSVSSETPVDRYFGREILRHTADAIDMSRLRDGAPVLFSHDPEKIVGVVERAWLVGKRLYTTFRWASSPLAQEIRQHAAEGILRNVSIGYSIQDAQETAPGEVTATRWTPAEVSLVSIPADPTVGLGRSLTPSNSRPMTRTTSTTEAQADNGAALAAISEAIGRLVEKIDGLERRAMQPAQPIQRSVPIAGAAPMSSYGTLGMDEPERRSYSLVKAIRAGATGDWSHAGLELEAHRALEKDLGRAARGVLVPIDAMQTRATYQVGTPSTGGNLVPQELLSGSFVEALRNRAAVTAMGATMLPGLVGNVAIPRRAAVSTAYWVAESQEITESNGGFDQINLTPKTLGALSNFSRLSSLQTVPEVEQLVRQDFVDVIALGVDAAALRGTGSSNEPLGIVNTTGIGKVLGATDGTQIDFDILMKMIKEVSIDNADTDGAGFLINSATEAALMQTKDQQDQYLIGPGAAVSGAPRALWGRPYMVTNQLRSNLVKGGSGAACSELLYGNFSDVLIGMWGPLEILTNPYGAGFKKGDIEIRVMMTCDVAIRHPESFCLMNEALTA